ncbi:MAG TPA: DUF2520 domain-containing protein [Solirubrobacteraceae bacterium]|nr:DUF2520 domain-containing protein [Solirubrobacteraceae bacterium]
MSIPAHLPGRPPDARPDPRHPACAIVGRGRLGSTLACALGAARIDIEGPLGRDEAPQADIVLLCVPDAAIAGAAAALEARPGRLVGHCSGATTLVPLTGHEAFSLHPLMTVPGAVRAPGDAGSPTDADVAVDPRLFHGAAGAVAGSTPRALQTARSLALAAGLRPIEITDADRATYHAAASMASNFLVTLEGAAERLGALAGLDREALAPLVRASVENWLTVGAHQALTGPVARGDEATVAGQRAAVAGHAPDLVGLFDELAARTRDLAATPARVAA